MQNQQINSLSDLDNAIAELEITQTEHLRLLKEQMSVAGNALQPMNLIKEVVLEATKSKNWKTLIGESSIAIASRYLNEKKESPEPHNNTFIQLALGLLASNSGFAARIIKSFLKRRS